MKARRAKPKSAKRRPLRRGARKRAVKKRAVKKRSARTRAAKKRAPKRAAPRRRPARKTAKKAAARRPPRKAARRPTAKPAPAFPQTATASGKQKVVFELIRARASVLAAIQGLPAGAGERPMSGDGWSARDVVLHLVVRDQVRLREMEGALLGRQASWYGISPADQDRANAEHLAALGPHGWDDAVRLLHSTREALMEALESVPEEPAEVWDPAHPFGWMLDGLPRHDRKHADAIKRWRAAGAKGE